MPFWVKLDSWSLPDVWMKPHKPAWRYVILFPLLFFLLYLNTRPPWASIVLAFGVTSCRETPKRLRGLCVRASLDIVVTRKWVNYPFKLVFYRMKETRCCLASLVHSGINDQRIRVIDSEKRHVWPQRPRGQFTLRFESLFLMAWLITSLFTPRIQEESRWDKGVNASGNAHPADKGKAEANRFDLFPMSGDWRRQTRKKVKSCFQVWLCGVCHNFSLGRDGTPNYTEEKLRLAPFLSV